LDLLDLARRVDPEALEPFLEAGRERLSSPHRLLPRNEEDDLFGHEVEDVREVYPRRAAVASPNKVL
jgi:hypothetical protein